MYTLLFNTITCDQPLYKLNGNLNWRSDSFVGMNVFEKISVFIPNCPYLLSPNA